MQRAGRSESIILLKNGKNSRNESMSILIKENKIHKIFNGNENIDVDYRCSVFFSAEKSKKQIYEIMNSIKANPITFLK